MIRPYARSLLRPSPLQYPAGALPGVDPNHIASAGGVVRLSAICTGKNFTALAPKLIKGTVTGTLNYNVHPIIGPCTGYSATAGSSRISLAGVSAIEDTTQTFGAIVVFTAAIAEQRLVVSGNSSNYLGMTIRSTPFSLGCQNGEFGSTVQSGTIIPTTNVPYFMAASVNGSNSCFLGLRLDTGAMIVATSTGLAPAGAPSGTACIAGDGSSESLGGYMAAACYTTAALNVRQLMEWAENPWSFWYPLNPQSVMFSGLTAPAASGPTLGWFGPFFDQVRLKSPQVEAPPIIPGTSPALASPYVQAPLFEPTRLKPRDGFEWRPFGTDPPLAQRQSFDAWFDPVKLKPKLVETPPVGLGTVPALASPYVQAPFFEPIKLKPKLVETPPVGLGTVPAIAGNYFTSPFFDVQRLKIPIAFNPDIAVQAAPAAISAYVPGALFDQRILMRSPAWDNSVIAPAAAATCNLTIDGSASNNSGSTSTPTVGPLSSTFANGKVIIFATYNLASGSISGISGGGLAFVRRNTIATGGGVQIFDEWAADVGSSPLSAVTFTATLSGTATFTFMQAFVVSNAGGTVAFDAGGPQSAATGGASMTTSESAMVFCGARFGTSGAPTASSPWTQIIGGVASSFSASEFQFPVAAGTYTGLFSGTDENGSIIDAIFCTGAGAVVTPSLASFFDAPTLKRPGVQFDWNSPGTSPALAISYVTNEWFDRVRLKQPIIQVPDIVPPMPGVFVNLDTWFDALRLLRHRLWDMDLPPAFTLEAPPPTAPFFDALRKIRVPDDFPFTKATVQLDTRLYALTDWFTAVRLRPQLVETPLVVYFPAQFVAPASAFTFPFIANMGSLTNR